MFLTRSFILFLQFQGIHSSSSRVVAPWINCDDDHDEEAFVVSRPRAALFPSRGCARRRVESSLSALKQNKRSSARSSNCRGRFDFPRLDQKRTSSVVVQEMRKELRKRRAAAKVAEKECSGSCCSAVVPTAPVEEVLDYRTYYETMAGLLRKAIAGLLRNLKVSRNVKWIYQEGISISGRCSLACFNGKL